MSAAFERILTGVEVLGSSYGFAEPSNDQGVVGYGYGWIRRGSVWTQDLGLVLLVERGRPGFPYSYLRVDGAHGPADVPCCAFVLDREPPIGVAAAAVPDSPPLAVGAPISVHRGRAVGTAAYASPDGRYLVTAAHVLAADDPTAEVYCGQTVIGARVAPVADDADAPFFDLAFVEVLPGLRGSGLARADGDPIGPPGSLTWGDLDQRASVYRPTLTTTERPWILAGGMTLHLLTREQRTITQTGMIMTESCTGPGDSGTGLVSAAGRTLGVLSHGRADFSFFTSLADAQRVGFWPKEEA